MGFWNDIKKGISKVYHDAKGVVKHAAPKIESVAKTVGNDFRSVGKGIGKFAKNAGDNVNNTFKNLSNLTSPQNLLLYAGVFIGALVLLPKILETPAAQRVADRV